MPDALIHDFSNPVVMAVIVNQDKERIPLWTNSFTEGGDLPALPVLTEITIEQQINFITKITATLGAGYADVIKFLNDRKIQYGRSMLEVQFGYVGQGGSAKLSPVYTGLILQPDVSIAPEEVSMTITAEATFGFSLQRSARRGKHLKGSREKLLKALLLGPDPSAPRKINLNTDAVSKAGGPALKALTGEPATAFVGAGQTDWLLVRKLIRDAGCWMRLDQETGDKPATLFVYPWDGTWTKEPEHTFAIFPGNPKGNPGGLQLGPTVGVYPILTFNTPTTATFYPTSLWGAAMRSVGDKSGKAEKQTMDPGSGDAKPTAKKPPAQRTGAGGAQPAGEFFPGVNTENTDGMESYNRDNIDKKSFEEYSSRVYGQMLQQYRSGGLKVEIGTLGVPDLYPGSTIRLVGLGEALFGNKNYAVFKVTHSLGTGGFSTNFEAWYNSSPFADAARAAAAPQNPDPKEPSGSNSGAPKGG